MKLSFPVGLTMTVVLLAALISIAHTLLLLLWF